MPGVAERSAATVRRLRPIIGVDVDGVIAVDIPARTPVHAYRVTAWGRWRRDILVPTSAGAALAALSQVADIVWISAWGHVAPGVLTPLLGLDPATQTWPFLPTQFGKAQALADYSGGRRWALINDDMEGEAAPPGGFTVVVDAHVGIAGVDVDDVIRQLLA